MRRYLVAFSLLAVWVHADPVSFWKQLTPEERRAAGLDRLTPAQQAALDGLVARQAKEGARQEVETATAAVTENTRKEVAAVRARAAAEQEEAVHRAREEARLEKEAITRKAREEAKAEAKAEQQRRKLADAGLAARSDDEPIHTRIKGDFRGWEGATVFTMENGQVWQQTDKQSRFFPKMENPEVVLEPSQFFGWKMYLAVEGLWIRVRRAK